MSQETKHDSNGPIGDTNVTGNIPATTTTVTFTQPSTQVTIVNGSSTTILYFNFFAAATLSNFQILPNSAFTYDGNPRTFVNIIGSAASGTYSIFAH